MRILSMDTTSAFGSIALADDGMVIEQMPLHSQDGFSQTLFGHIASLLTRHDWKLDSVGCFAATAGPGSFTGVRVGLTAIKGLAEALGSRAIGVSNLQALAAYGTAPVRAVLTDARRGEIYGAVYDQSLRPIVPEAVVSFREWLQTLPEQTGEIVTTDFAPFRAALTRNMPVVEQRSLAAAVAGIARARLQSGDAGDPASIDANYVRRPDAELLWRS